MEPILQPVEAAAPGTAVACSPPVTSRRGGRRGVRHAIFQIFKDRDVVPHLTVARGGLCHLRMAYVVMGLTLLAEWSYLFWAGTYLADVTALPRGARPRRWR